MTQLREKSEDHNGVYLYQVPVNISPQMAKDVAFALKPLLREQDFVYIAASNDGGKPTLTLMLSDSM